MRSCPNLEQVLPSGAIPDHRHATAYLTVVLDGHYLECGSAGRWRVEPGWVVAHAIFDRHRNAIHDRGATVINAPLPADWTSPPVFQLDHPDELVRAMRHREAAATEVWASMQGVEPMMEDWPDLLAMALRRGPVRLGDWAARQGLPAATVSRGFHRAFGVTPSQYRKEAQTLAALRAVLSTPQRLTDAALHAGFADQAHFCRAVKAMTGTTASRWRGDKSIQASALRGR